MLTPHIVRGADITPQNLEEIDTGPAPILNCAG